MTCKVFLLHQSKTEQDGLGKDGREVLHAMVDATSPENLS
uniref:Uncharacterized protein n=1 Tax=Anguilla anguilla TaxID=7936 RepID=A0A0E9PDE3_ANGAN